MLLYRENEDGDFTSTILSHQAGPMGSLLELKIMNYVRKRIDKGAKRSRVNVEVPEKPAESFAVEQTQTAVKTVEGHKTVQKQQDEKLDLWMKNIKEFIRNIDVKSL